ncbi:MAG: hypothetical protein WCB48_14610, partial [Casimicrobiaceae bacterium]
MTTVKSRSKVLEQAANIGIILAAAVTICGWSWYLLRGANPRSQPKYSVGNSLEPVTELKDLPAKPALLLYLSRDCSACNHGMEFYRELTIKQRSVPIPPALAVITHDEA